MSTEDFPFYCIPTKGRFAMGIAYVRIQSSTDVRLVFDDKGERQAPYDIETVNTHINDGVWEKVNDRKAEAFRLNLQEVLVQLGDATKRFVTQKAANAFLNENSKPDTTHTVNGRSLWATANIPIRTIKDMLCKQNFVSKMTAEESAMVDEALCSWSDTGNMDGSALVDFNLSDFSARVREF